jgi:predicted secreted protein
MDDEGHEHRTGTEARAGTTPHVARVVLIAGTGLTIIIFAIILFVAG